MKRIFCLPAIIALGVGCANKECNNVPQNPYVLNATPTPTPAPGGSDDFVSINVPKTSPTPPPDEVKAEDPKQATVSVFTSTGEVQCSEGKGISLEKAQQPLNASKIKVFSAHTQADGMLHMAVCGASAGNIHVFKIPKKDLKRAEKLGFKVFKGAK